MAGLEELFVEKEVKDPNYEGWKKLYETNPDAAEMNENHAEYLKRYTLEISTSDASEAGILGTEEANMEFVEADNGEEVIVDDRINLMAAAPDGQPFLSGDQSATTLFMGNGGFAMQGGVRNYLGETNTVSGVPIKWKSAPDHPETELAYITKKEKDLLLKKDLHNSLDGSPNKGPEGLMSLNGGGYGSENAGTGGNDGFGGGNDNSNDYTGADYGFVASQPTTNTVSTPDYDYRGPADLGVTTRTVNTVKAPEAKEYIGGKEYDVTPETKDERNRAEVKEQIMSTPPSTKKFEVIDPITKTTLTSDKKTKKGFGGFSLLDVVLFVGTTGIINPEVTKIAKAITNVKTGLTVSSLVADKKTKGIKGTAKDILTSIAKDKISKKTGFSVKTIDTTLDTIEKALNTELGKSVVDRFNSLNKETTTDPNERFSDSAPTRSDNDNDNNNSNRVITPVVPELIAEKIVVEEPTSSLSDLATLRLIRDRQARRKSFFNANSGGLAGLFKVKKQ